MNIFKFLKNRAGKVDLAGVAGVGATVALAGVAVSGYLTDTPAAQDKQVRSLSQLMASGQDLPREYSSVRVQVGDTPFATLEERAAMEGAIFDAGEGALTALDQHQAGFSVQAGSLAEGEGGLGMGQNLATAIDAGGQGGAGFQPGAAGAAAGAAVASAVEGQTRGAQAGAAGESGFRRASLARATGSNLGSGSGMSAAGRLSGGANSVKSATQTDRQSRIGASSISGNMPAGTTLVASNSGVRTAASSSFGADRSGRVGSGSNSAEGKSLREIAVGSAKVAANANRSANEGVRPFMASNKLSGGVNVDDGMTEQGQASGSFEDDLNNSHTRLGQAAQDDLQDQLEREAHRSRLQKMLFATLITTLVAMGGIGAMVQKGGVWGWIGAAAIAAVALGVIGVYMADAIKYIDKYGWDGWSTASVIMSTLYIGGIGCAFIPKVGKFMSKMLTKVFGSTFGMIVGGAIAGTSISTAVDGTVESIKSWSDENGDGLKNG